MVFHDFKCEHSSLQLLFINIEEMYDIPDNQIYAQNYRAYKTCCIAYKE